MKTFALVLGIVFAVVGVLGFVPGVVTEPIGMAPDQADHGLLLGLFPVNGLHNLVHLGFGIWGIIASQTFDHARLYTRVTAVSYAVLAVFGAIPGLQTLFGFVPIYGHDVWLHAVIALAAGYFGWLHHASTAESGGTPVRM